MAFGNRNKTNTQKENTQRRNVNTKVYQMYRPDAGDDSSTISLGYWNNQATITINPAFAEKDREEKKVYDYENNQYSVLLKPKELLALQKQMTVLELQAKKGGAVNSFALKVGANKILEVGTGAKYDDMGWYIAIYLVDPKTDITEDGIYFLFNTEADSDMVVYNFNENTGKGSAKSMSATLPLEYEIIREFAQSARQSILSGNAHGVEVALQGKFASLENAIGKGGTSSSSTTKSGPNSSFRNRRNRMANNSSSVEDSLVDDLDNDLDDLDNTNNAGSDLDLSALDGNNIDESALDDIDEIEDLMNM